MLIADSQVHVQSVSCVSRLALWILKYQSLEPSRPPREGNRVLFLSYGECGTYAHFISVMDKASLQHQDDLPATLVRIRRGILHIGAQLQNIGKNASVRIFPSETEKTSHRRPTNGLELID